MIVARKVSAVLRWADGFKTTGRLLYKGEEVASVFSGVVTLIVIALTMFLFWPNLMQFLSFQSFSYKI
jgi:hypothetical protein